MITAKTKITGLFGFPVEHSLSPGMHNAGFKQLNLDYRYLGFSVHPDNLPGAVQGIQAMNFAGVNVTIPHKERVIPLLDEIEKEAQFIGAVNTIQNKDGKLIGHNTDGRGFMKFLEEKKIDPRDKEVFIIGAGGASRAIGYYLCQMAKKLTIFDIDSRRLDKLTLDLQKIRANVYAENNLDKIADSFLIINATPLGLKPDDPLPLNANLLTKAQVVCDLIYKDTELLKEAQTRECTTVNGLGMLLWQGVLAFEIWTGCKAPVEIMRKALHLGFANSV